jgi:hypothetical protein
MQTDCCCHVLPKRVAQQPSQGLILRVIQGGDSLIESLRRGLRTRVCSHRHLRTGRFELGVLAPERGSSPNWTSCRFEHDPLECA